VGKEEEEEEEEDGAPPASLPLPLLAAAAAGSCKECEPTVWAPHALTALDREQCAAAKALLAF
jgi:hypothetical protein